MTWDIERKKSLNKPFAVIEADMDFCGRVWGEGVCQPDNSQVTYADTFTDTDRLLQTHTSEDGYGWIKSSEVGADDWSIVGNEVVINEGTSSVYYHNLPTATDSQSLSADFVVSEVTKVDNFTDVDGTLLHNHITADFTWNAGGIGTNPAYVQSNQLYLPGGETFNESHTTADKYAGNRIEFTLSFDTDYQLMWLYLLNDLGYATRYSLLLTNSPASVGCTLYINVGGVLIDSVIGSLSLADKTEVKYRLEFDADTVRLYINDNLIIDYTESSVQKNFYIAIKNASAVILDPIRMDDLKISFTSAATISAAVRSVTTTSDTSDRYLVELQTNTGLLKLIKSVSGVPTTLAGKYITPVTGGTAFNFKVEYRGEILSAYIDNVLELSISDSLGSTGGYPAVYITSTVGGVTLDNFISSIGEVVAKTLACRNTWPSCQDTSNFLLTTKTYTFYENIVDAPITDISGHPSLKKFTQTPSKITDGIGYRATLTFRLSDFTHHDKGVDPYVADRDYDPKTRGTFMGRFVKNNPFVIGREVRLRNGYLTDTFDWANFQTSTYVIDHIKGPDNNGDYVVTCKDVLYRLKDVMLPKPSQVKTTEAVTIDASTISVDLTGDKFLRVFNGGSYTDIEVTTSLPSYDSAGNLRSTPFTTITGAVPTDPSDTLYMPFYDSTGTFQPIALSSDGLADGDTVTVLIDDELIEGTYAGGIITVTQRGAGGTDPDTHDLGANVQTCIVVEDLPIDEVLVLLLTLAGINPAYFDTAGWAEQAKLLSLLRVTATFARPEKLTSILNKLAEQFTFRMWWDERYQLIKMLAMFPQGDASLLPVISDELNILHRVKKRPVRPTAVHSAEKMISQMWVNYKKRDLSKSDDLDNLGAQYIAINLNAEKPQALDGPKPKSLNAEFVNTETHASLLASRWGAFYGDVQSTVDFYLSEKDIGEVWLGSEFIIDSDVLQDLSGANDNVRMQVIAAAEQDGAYKMTAEKSIFQGDRYAYIAAADASDYSSATEFEKATQAYICDAFGYIGDDKGYTII